ncbi:MAG: hypothetical protein WKI04_07045 [Ferruginibacter sp.]
MLPLINDRDEKSKYRPMKLRYKKEDISIPIEVKSRGHFRKVQGNCDYPPLLVQFKKSAELSSSVFKGQDKLNLVMPCKHDQHVVLE